MEGQLLSLGGLTWGRATLALLRASSSRRKCVVGPAKRFPICFVSFLLATFSTRRKFLKSPALYWWQVGDWYLTAPVISLYRHIYDWPINLYRESRTRYNLPSSFSAIGNSWNSRVLLKGTLFLWFSLFRSSKDIEATESRKLVVPFPGIVYRTLMKYSRRQCDNRFDMSGYTNHHVPPPRFFETPKTWYTLT